MLDPGDGHQWDIATMDGAQNLGSERIILASGSAKRNKSLALQEGWMPVRGCRISRRGKPGSVSVVRKFPALRHAAADGVVVQICYRRLVAL